MTEERLAEIEAQYKLLGTISGRATGELLAAYREARVELDRRDVRTVEEIRKAVNRVRAMNLGMSWSARKELCATLRADGIEPEKQEGDQHGENSECNRSAVRLV